MAMRECKSLEFKESVTNSFLKTVSAFANHNGGVILFGVNDAGEPVGLPDPVAACLDIENKVNDTITPRPSYSLDIHSAGAVVELRVEKGPFKPYRYRSKAYKRSDSSTMEVDGVELNRLILEGKNMGFEELPAHEQELSFTYLGEALAARMGLDEFNRDTLRTLGLLSGEGYNNAAAILADENDFPGIDLAQFGDSINVIRRRTTTKGRSILREFNEAMQMFEDIYCYEEISGPERISVDQVPKEAFREALANALVHRTWDVPPNVRISMFDDRIEVVSPGGLPSGITQKEYLSGKIPLQRNPLIANVFFRLGIIEAFGTGVLRIKNAYSNSLEQPIFNVGDNHISVTLPVRKTDLGLKADEQLVFDLLSVARPIAAGELTNKVGFSRSKLTSILKGLMARNLVGAVGAGRGRKYIRN